jgi:uncharacterized protein YkwD
MRLTFVFGALLLVASCSKDGVPTSPSAAGGSGGGASMSATASDLAFCVTETNRYRAQANVRALSQSDQAQEFAAAAARADHLSGTAHGYINGPNRPTGNYAENQANRWPTALAGGSARGFIERALAGMWAEGPGGGHYENIRGAYTLLGCAIYADATSATFVQHFR